MTLKHYAYFNMSRQTQLTTKYIFQILAQLSENFIFIYLGLALFTDNALQFRPLLIIVTVLAVCAARWVAVFPLSRAINWVIRYKARRRGSAELADELAYNHQAMLFWAGLRGAVGVALAALLSGENSYALKATVLVVVVLTVIIFGGTTARMLEILGIQTGVVDEIDSDDEFDIETLGGAGGSYYKRPGGTGIGYIPRRNGNMSLQDLEGQSAYVSGHQSPNPTRRPSSLSRKNFEERADLLGRGGNNTDSDLESDIDTSDLPPPAQRPPPRGMAQSSPMLTPGTGSGAASSPATGAVDSPSLLQPVVDPTEVPPVTAASAGAHHVSAGSAIRQLFSSEDPGSLFRQFDEDYIKPKLLLDSGHGYGHGHGHGQRGAPPGSPSGGAGGLGGNGGGSAGPGSGRGGPSSGSGSVV